MDFQAIIDETREYYDFVAARYNELFRHELQEKELDQNVLKTFAGYFRPQSLVVDAGCGPCGHVTSFLNGTGVTVCGIDNSPRCIEIARREHPKLAFQVMDLLKMRFAESSLDGIVAYYALLCMPKACAEGALREFNRVLVEGGKLLITLKEGVGEGYIADPMGSGKHVYFSYFTEAEICTMLSANGFRVLYRITRDPYPHEICNRRIFVIAERRSTTR